MTLKKALWTLRCGRPPKRASRFGSRPFQKGARLALRRLTLPGKSRRKTAAVGEGGFLAVVNRRDGAKSFQGLNSNQWGGEGEIISACDARQRTTRRKSPSVAAVNDGSERSLLWRLRFAVPSLPLEGLASDKQSGVLVVVKRSCPKQGARGVRHAARPGRLCDGERVGGPPRRWKGRFS